MSEIERAIETLEEELKLLYGHANLADQATVDAHELALKLLRAELDREKNPLTCDGCKWHPIKHDFLGCIISRCENCCRQTVLTDRYEPKGEPNV